MESLWILIVVFMLQNGQVGVGVEIGEDKRPLVMTEAQCDAAAARRKEHPPKEVKWVKAVCFGVPPSAQMTDPPAVTEPVRPTAMPDNT